MLGLSFAKSHYSLLESNIKIHDLLVYANDFDYEYVALADTNNLHGALEFIVNSKKYNIKPIIGMEITVSDNKFSGNILLFAKSNKGFKKMQQLSTDINVNNKIITWEELYNYSQNMILVISQKQMPSISIDIPTSKKFIEIIQSKFANIFLSIGKNPEDIEDKKISKLASQTNIDVIVSNPILFINKNDFVIPEILQSIKKSKKANLKSEEFKNNYLKNKSEINSNFSEKIINNTNIFFKETYFDIKLEKTTQPDFEVDGKKSNFIKKICVKSLKQKLNLEIIPEKYMSRLEKELGVISELNFENYFLIVWDFVKYANENDIAVGPGRGSAAGSLVSYSLNITKVDPIKYNLLFERFLNIERVSMPDIDIDFEDEKREEVINYIVKKYGFKHVAYISTFQTIGAKMSIRDIGRCLEISISQIDLLTKKIPNKANITIQEALDLSISFRKEATKSIEIEKIIKLAQSIEGVPRQLGTHAAGIVISKKPLEQIAPLIISKTSNVLQIQYSMHNIKQLGLLKMDFLGIKNLTTIKNIIKMIKKTKNIEIDINKIPLNDVKTFKLLSSGITEGIFQLESSGMKEVLKGLQPRSIEDLSIVIALYRPGPMDNIPLYIRRRHGKEQIKYLHPNLEPILKNTYGIIVYQEQIMQIAKHIAGFTYSKADILRKAMSNKDITAMMKLEEEFILGAKLNGYDYKMANQIYKLIYKFANYGFNSAHSISYSFIGYQLAYLKAYYPKLFLVSLLTINVGNDEKLKKYLYEAKKIKINIACPSINYSTTEFTHYNNIIYLPFTIIRNIGRVTTKLIIEIRNNVGKFQDFLHAVSELSKKSVKEKMIKILIQAGAFDEFNYSRESLIHALPDFIKYTNLLPDSKVATIINDDIVPIPKISNISDDIENKLEVEYQVLGYYISSHPIKLLKNKIEKDTNAKIYNLNEISEYGLSKQIAVLAMVKSIRIIKTKKGYSMIFLILEDYTGESEAVIFPRIFTKVRHKVSYRKILGFTGKYDKENNSFIIENVKSRNEIIK